MPRSRLTFAIGIVLLTGAILLPASVLLSQRADDPWPRYPWVNHDALGLLLTGRQITLGRGQLYRDSWDSNFPAIHTITILINELTGGHPIATVNLFHGLVFALAWFGGLCLITGGRSPPLTLPLVAGYLLAVLCPVVPAAPEFGQREHLFSLVLFPWLAWRLRLIDPPSSRLRVPLAFLLGWLGTIKPTFLLIPVAVEAIRPAADRARGVIVAAVIAGMIVPWLPFVLLDPVAIRVFFTEVLPVHLTPWYRLGFGIPWHEVARRPQAIVAWAEGIALALLVSRGRLRGVIGATEARGWTVAAAVAAFGVFVQGTGFAYHFIPVQTVLLLGILATAVRVIGDRFTLAAAVIAASLGASAFVTNVRWRRVEPSPIVRIVPAHASVMVFSTDVLFAYDAWHRDWILPGTWGAFVLLEGQTLDPDRRRGEAGLARDRENVLSALRSRPEFLLVRHSAFRGYADVEDALIRALRVLPAHGYRRLSDAEVARRAGPDAQWAVYARQRVR